MNLLYVRCPVIFPDSNRFLGMRSGNEFGIPGIFGGSSLHPVVSIHGLPHFVLN